MTKDSDFGVIYAAYGRDYIAEAHASAKSLKAVNPEIPLAIFVDQPEAVDRELFDHVTVLPPPASGSYVVQHPMIYKIESMQRSPFAKTVYLDADIHVVKPISDLSMLLDRFELAVAFDPIRHVYYSSSPIPDSFPAFNCGVIAYRDTESVKAFIKDWKEEFRTQAPQEGRNLCDQPPFRSALYRSAVRFTVLPDEYNLRIIFPHLVGGNTHIKLLHGRHEHVTKALAYADSKHFYPRVFGRNYAFMELAKMLCQRGAAGLRTRLRLGRNGGQH